MLSVGLHCRLAGRPARTAALERFLDHVQTHDHVWVARRVDIARHWIDTSGPADGSGTRNPPPHGRGGKGAGGDPLSVGGYRYAAGGISTVSIRYTVALAVCTPPHATEASLTMSWPGCPVTVTSPPWTVLWVPTTCDGSACPGTTW